MYWHFGHFIATGPVRPGGGPAGPRVGDAVEQHALDVGLAAGPRRRDADRPSRRRRGRRAPRAGVRARTATSRARAAGPTPEAREAAGRGPRARRGEPVSRRRRPTARPMATRARSAGRPRGTAAASDVTRGDDARRRVPGASLGRARPGRGLASDDRGRSRRLEAFEPVAQGQGLRLVGALRDGLVQQFARPGRVARVEGGNAPRAAVRPTHAAARRGWPGRDRCRRGRAACVRSRNITRVHAWIARSYSPAK